MKDTIFERNQLLKIRGELYEISQAWVMGILNLTTDSFYDGGQYNRLDQALRHTENMLLDGAKIIDVGASSSRPGAPISKVQEEITSLSSYLNRARGEFPDAFFSIDTYHAEVARAAADLGADMINDISGGQLDKQMAPVMGELGLPYIMMHMKGSPATMQREANYDNVFKDLSYYFSKQIELFRSHNVHDLIIDPGFGFAKNLEHNYELLGKLSEFKMLGLPILVGISRKSMIRKLLEVDSEASLNGTTVLNTIALMKGANILRVHDVKEAVEAVKILTFIQNYT